MVFSPFEEICLEGELVIFESVEVMKSNKKFVDVMVYNPTKQKIYLQKGKALGQVSNAAAAYTLPMIQKSSSVGEVKVEWDIKDQIKNLNLDGLDAVQKDSVVEL